MISRRFCLKKCFEILVSSLEKEVENGQGKEIASRIVVNEEKPFGKPVIKGARVPVDLLLGKLDGRMKIEEVTAEYVLGKEDVLAALDYVAEVISQEEIRVTETKTATGS